MERSPDSPAEEMVRIAGIRGADGYAAEALRLCIAGEVDAGLALYRAHGKSNILDVPFGLHAHMIEQAGRPEAAEALRAFVLKNGGDLSWRSGLPSGSTPEASIAEYEALFARGALNSRMIDRYIQLLSSAGRIAEVEALNDFPRRLWQETNGDAASVAQALANAEPSLPLRSSQSERNLRHMKALHRSDAPAFVAVLEMIRAAVTRYFSDWATSDHPFAAFVPTSFDLRAWGTIARADGYHTRHQHPIGWASGVYYPVDLPAGSVGGALRIGGWQDPAPPGWPSATIRPRAGLLVLMPSWYVHWTEPIAVGGARMAVAFDAVPRR